jgi:hypothetical protein
MLTNPSLDVTVVKILDILLLKICAIASLKRKKDHKDTIGLILLKVLTNGKRGRLTVVTFDRSLFKLFSLRFSN